MPHVRRAGQVMNTQPSYDKPFLDPATLVGIARQYIPVAERAAQDAYVRGDMREYRNRTADADWYRSLIDTYADEARDFKERFA